jgi:hypothetical protein
MVAVYIGEWDGIGGAGRDATQSYQSESGQCTPRRSDLSGSASPFRHLHVNPPKSLKNSQRPIPRLTAREIDADSSPVGVNLALFQLTVD